MMRYRPILLIGILFILLSSMASAQVTTGTTLQTNTNGLEIKFPSLTTIKLNTDYDFNFHIFDTNGSPITSGIGCYFHLYNQTGSHIYWTNYSLKTFEEMFDISVLVDGGNFSYIGEYSYLFQCNDSAMGGYVANTFRTKAVYTESSTGNSIMYSILLFVALMLLIICMASAIYIQGDNEYDLGGIIKFNYKKYLKIGLWFLSYQMLIFVVYLSYEIALAFFTATFMASIFKVIFYLLLAGQLPVFFIVFVATMIKWFADIKLKELMMRGLEER